MPRSLPPHALIGASAGLLARRYANRHAALAGAGTGLDIDGDDPFETLHPAHRGGWLVGIDVPGTLRHDALAVLEVGRV